MDSLFSIRTSCARMGKNILADEVLLVNSVNIVITAPHINTKAALGMVSKTCN